MKILHVTKKYPDALGGDAVVVSSLEKHQKANDHKVVILTSNCDEIKDDGHIYKVGLKDSSASFDSITPKRLLSLIILFFKSFKILHKEKPDAIHTHSVDMAFFVSFAARHYHIPIVHTFHIVTNYDMSQSLLRRKTELALVRGAQPVLITAPNKYDVKKLKQAGLHRVSILPNGVDLDFWHKDPNIKPSKIFTFLTVGRLEEQKGIQYLIKAAAKLRNQIDRKFKVIIVGEGSLRLQLEELASSLKLDDTVEFVGRKTPLETHAIYSSSHVAVFSSLYETTPLTLLEAWAMGVPVIATPVGILRHKKNANSVVLAKMRDEKSLAAAMGELINNPRQRAKLAQLAHKEVAQLSWANIERTAHKLYLETQE